MERVLGLYGGGVDPVVATLAILVVAVAAFATNRIPLGCIAICVSLSLYLTGVLSLSQSLSGFGDPTVLFIAALFVVSESLDATGVTAWAGQRVLGAAGTGRTALVVVISLLVALLSALVSVTGAVAALLPLVVVVAARARIPASQLLLPLVFVGHAGSLLLLTGTPVNIVVSEAAADNGGRQFGFAEFAIVGVPLVLGTMLVVLLLGPRLLPLRSGRVMSFDLGRHAHLMREEYALTQDTGTLMNPLRGLTEVVVAPRSSLIGVTLGIGRPTPSGDLVLLAAGRGGVPFDQAEFVAQAGDALLLQGSWEDLATHAANGKVIPVDSPAELRRAVPLGRGAKRSLVVLVAMIVLLATGAAPPAVVALGAACALVLSRALTAEQAYRSISWTTVVLIGGMIPLSTAFLTTGAADKLATRLLSLIGGLGPSVVLLAVCLITVGLGQIISNTATVLIVAPVAIALAEAMSVSVQPFMMALTIAGAAAFLTPIATPANLMVMVPGGYRFGDYWKLGLPLAALFVAVAVLYVPLIWPFRT